MADPRNEKRVFISDDTASMADAVAGRFLDRLSRRLHGGRIAHVALTGGTSGTAVLAAVGSHEARNRVDWSRVHVWWGDERFVPRGSAERNETGARRGLLDRVTIPEANIHAMAASDGGLDLDDGATAYAAELARFGTAGRPWPSFDVCFLGVGPDGHIASLFPDRAEIQIVDRAVTVVRNSPKPPPERLSLTRPVINTSKRVWMVLGGADKASALGLALAGASYESVPAAGAKGRKQTRFFVDRAAAAEVPADLIEQDW
ncbi:6-phosphogluconolactonase [Microbacterium sp.]|uniref:6-phosphogluconolactonase n=1 Tax=Microbacterium sp. TaxID=51671 RepID=UPI003A83DFD0